MDQFASDQCLLIWFHVCQLPVFSPNNGLRVPVSPFFCLQQRLEGLRCLIDRRWVRASRRVWWLRAKTRIPLYSAAAPSNAGVSITRNSGDRDRGLV